MSNIGSLTAYIDLNNTRLQRDMMQSQAMFTRFASDGATKIKSLTASVGKLGGAFAALGVTIGGGLLLRSIDQIGTEFEQTMAVVGGVMRATTDELNDLTAAARRMGESTEWTASQAGESLKYLGMAGFNAQKAIAALPGTLDLATAGNIDLGLAADIATNALTAMGLPVEELSRVNDVFVGTITRSNTNIVEMAEAFKYGAPLAYAYGYSIEELSAMIGQLASSGIKGSMAGTQLSMAMQKANDIANMFGYKSSDLVDVLKSMSAEGRTATDVMELFGVRAGKAALTLLNSIEPVRDFQKILNGVAGEAQTLADKMRDTIGGWKKTLSSVFESIKIDVFETFRDDLKNSIGALTEWLRDNRKNIIEFARGTVTAFKEIASVIKVIWDTISGFTGGVVKSLSGISDKSHKTALAMELDGARIRTAFKPPELTEWQKFAGTWMNISNGIVQGALFLVKTVGNLLGTMISDIATVLAGALKIVYDASDMLLKNITLRHAAANKALDKLGEDFKAVWDMISKTGNNSFDNIVTDWNSMIASLKAPSGLKEDLASIVQGRANAFLGKVSVPKLANHAKDVIPSTTAVEDLEAKYSSMIDTQVGAYRELLKETSLTKEQLLAIWDNYKVSRVAQIGIEVKALYESGVMLDAIVQHINISTKNLEKEYRGLTGGIDAIADAQVQIYRNMLSEEKLSVSALHKIWEQYEAARKTQIMNEAKQLEAIGVSAGEIVIYVSKQLRDLTKDQRAIFEAHGSWLRDFIKSLAQDMREILSEFFFDAMAGDFKKLTDYLEAVWEAFIRRMSSKAANELTDLFSNADNTGWLDSLGISKKPAAIPAMATGGIVTSPTLAQIGEIPEAVIPLHKLRDERFMRMLGTDTGSDTSSGDVYINFNIQTPDIASFKQSQQQIITQAAIAMRQARRNR